VLAGFRGFRRFVTRKKSRCKLIGNRLVIPHDTIPSTVGGNFNDMQKVIYYIQTVLVLFLVQKTMASPQLPDYLIYKGDTLAVYDLILEQYLAKIKTPDQGDLFGLKFRDGASFNCWRGYQAIYN